MNWRGTLALFVVLVAMAGIYFGMERRGQQQAQQAQEAKRLFDFKPEDVTKLTIQQVNEKAVVGLRENGAWKITEPNPTIPAFPMLWDRVSEHLANLMNERGIETTELKLADYELDVPALKIQAEAAGRQIELAFGKLDPTQEKRYALLDGKQLFLASKNAFFELNRSLDDLRNKFTVNDREANILRFEFAQIWQGDKNAPMENPPEIGQESPPIITARESKDAPWKLITPREAAADQEVVGNIVKELQFAIGRQFVDDIASLKDYGLEPAKLRITLVDDKGGEPQTFLFGATDEATKGVWVRRPDRDGVFMLDPQLFLLLPRSPDGFQERRLLTQQAMDFARVVITNKGQTCELINDPAKGWKALPEDNFETDQAAVSTYITALKRAKGESIVQATIDEVGLLQPETMIQLFPRDGGKPAEIRVQSKPDDPTMAVAQQDLGAVMTIKRETADALQVDPLYFRSRKLWKVEPAAVREMTMTFDGKACTFKHAHDAWSVTAPEGMLIGAGAMEAWLKALAELRVVTPRPESGVAEDALGFASPMLSLTLTTGPEGEPGQTIGPLEVGAATAEKMMQRYVRLAGQQGVYRVEQSLVDAAREFVNALQAQ